MKGSLDGKKDNSKPTTAPQKRLITKNAMKPNTFNYTQKMNLSTTNHNEMHSTDKQKDSRMPKTKQVTKIATNPNSFDWINERTIACPIDKTQVQKHKMKCNHTQTSKRQKRK